MRNVTTFQARDDRGTWRDIPYGGMGVLHSRKGFRLHRQYLRVARLVSRPHLYVFIGTLCALAIGMTIGNLAKQLYGQAIFGIAVACFALLWIPAFRMHARKLRKDVDTVDPVCPACAYDLSGTPIASDGCRVCSECAAAWKFARDANLSPPHHAAAADPPPRSG